MIGTRSRTDLELLKLDRLDNAALAALAQPKPNTNSKYNFYVKLGNNNLIFRSVNRVQLQPENFGTEMNMFRLTYFCNCTFYVF